MAVATWCEQVEVFLGRVGLRCQQQVVFSYAGTLGAEAQLQYDQTQPAVFLQPHLGITALFDHCKKLQECYLLHNLNKTRKKERKEKGKAMVV